MSYSVDTTSASNLLKNSFIMKQLNVLFECQYEKKDDVCKNYTLLKMIRTMQT